MKTGLILVCRSTIPNGREHGIKWKLFIVVSRVLSPKRGIKWKGTWNGMKTAI